MSLSQTIDLISLGKIVQIRERLLKAQAAGKKVFRFESGDPNFSLAPHIEAALIEAAQTGKTHYIPNNGIPELKAALAKKISHKNNIKGFSAEDIYVTNGAMHALFVTFSCLLKTGDEVIVPDPMWTEVVENIRLGGGVPVGIPLRAENNFEYDPAEIERRISSNTKAIFLNTPHNPTGAILSKETLLRIGEIAKKHGLFIVSDEAYEDVVFEPEQHYSIASLMPDYIDKIITVFSFSKSYAMSGLRVGYLVTRDTQLRERLPKLLRCTINGVNSVAQWTALAATTGDALHVKAMRDEYQLRRDIMMEGLTDIPGLKPFKARGTFFLWAEVDSSLYKRLGLRNGDELSNALAEAGLGSAPGDCFGQSCENAIRFAFSCSTQMVREGVPHLRNFLIGKT